MLSLGQYRGISGVSLNGAYANCSSCAVALARFESEEHLQCLARDLTKEKPWRGSVRRSRSQELITSAQLAGRLSHRPTPPDRTDGKKHQAAPTKGKGGFPTYQYWGKLSLSSSYHRSSSHCLSRSLGLLPSLRAVCGVDRRVMGAGRVDLLLCFACSLTSVVDVLPDFRR